MSQLVGSHAPLFVAKAVFPDNGIREFSLESQRGRFVTLVFYPNDFSFVCPSELVALNNRLSQFRELNTVVAAISVDSEYAHLAWKSVAREEGGIGNLDFPLISDVNKLISTAYDVLSPEGVSMRASFLIDRMGIIRHMLVNDESLGRSVDEALRMVNALQFSEEHGQVCPADWQKGQEGIEKSREGVGHYFSVSGAGRR